MTSIDDEEIKNDLSFSHKSAPAEMPSTKPVRR